MEWVLPGRPLPPLIHILLVVCLARWPSKSEMDDIRNSVIVTHKSMKALAEEQHLSEPKHYGKSTSLNMGMPAKHTTAVPLKLPAASVERTGKGTNKCFSRLRIAHHREPTMLN